MMKVEKAQQKAKKLLLISRIIPIIILWTFTPTVWLSPLISRIQLTLLLLETVRDVVNAVLSAFRTSCPAVQLRLPRPSLPELHLSRLLRLYPVEHSDNGRPVESEEKTRHQIRTMGNSNCLRGKTRTEDEEMGNFPPLPTAVTFDTNQGRQVETSSQRKRGKKKNKQRSVATSADVTSMNEADLELLKRENHKLQNDVRLKKDELSQANNENCQLKKEIKRLTEEINQREEMLRKYQRDMEKRSEEDHDKHVKEMMNSNMRLKTDFTLLEGKYERLRKENHDLVVREKETSAKCDEYKVKAEDMEEQFLKMEKNYESVISELNHQKKELSDMTSRFTKAVSDSLRLGNPALEDLSTQHRPLRLAERFQVDLYGNAWSEAIMELEDEGHGHDQACRALFENLTRVYQFCLEQRKRLLGADWDYLLFRCKNTEDPGTRDSTPLGGMLTAHENPLIKQIVMDLLRKTFRPQTVNALRELYSRAPLRDADTEKSPPPGDMVEQFTVLSLELCWLFLIQDPPMVLYDQLPEDKMVDTKMYECYLKTSTHAQYVIWPALLLHSGGNVLSKGKVVGDPS